MAHYSYRVSFRVMHPAIDPKIITGRLRVQPERSWRVGDPRSTPKGTPLDGTNRETYWSSEVSRGSEPDEPRSLEQCLRDSNQALHIHKAFLQELVQTGGRLEYFVGLFCNGNVGAVFDAALLQETAALGIAIVFDIYPA